VVYRAGRWIWPTELADGAGGRSWPIMMAALTGLIAAARARDERRVAARRGRRRSGVERFAGAVAAGTAAGRRRARH
jgi:hypothetical protein